MSLDDVEPKYEVLESEQAEADRNAIYLRLNPLVGPERASLIYQGLRLAMDELSKFPGPRANAVDFQATDLFRIEVRRALYSGPIRGRRIPTPYRILYTIIEPQSDSTGIVRILRVLHGSQELNPRAE